MINRRKFIKNTTKFTASAAILSSLGCLSSTKNMGKIDPFGLQLYTLMDVFPQDVAGTLETVSKFGYKYVEGYEMDKGLWWGNSPKQFKTLLDHNGLQMISSHCSYKENLERKADEAAEVGLQYLICPWVGPQKSIDDWKIVTDSFNKSGEICKKAGLKFAYHNHEYSFKAFSGMIPHDFLMENTDPSLVLHEMDIYWVITSGKDPKEFLRKYKKRFVLCHVKDRMQNTDETHASCDLGTGKINFPDILKTAKQCGMKYFFVEQERFDNSTSVRSVERNAMYMKNLVI
jgi:sugar phosphate isomerase/epimerase